MLINLINALMSGKRLPYDAEVEYLESSGTQYIDTGVKLSASDMVYVSFSLTNAEYSAIFGAGSADGASGRTNSVYLQNRASLVFQCTKESGVSISYSSQTEYDVYCRISDGLMVVNGVNCGTNDTPLESMNYSTFVFCRNLAGRADRKSKMRLHSFSIVRNGERILDYIPVRKGTVGYLYDRVSGKLFGNEGSGAFSYGSDVVQVEYIQSDGNAYLDTGVVPAPNLDYSVTFSAQSASTYYRIFGAWAASNQKRFGAIVNAQNLMYQQMTPHGEVLSAYTSPNIMTAEKRGLDCYVNGSKAGSFTSDIEANEVPYSIHVLGINTRGSAIAASAGERVYAFSLTSNSVAVRSMLPVRVGTEGAMMDVLTRRIYRNAGTGAFGYGNDLKYPIPSE